MNTDLIYLNYWKRKQLMSTSMPKFSMINYWQSEQLSEPEQIIFDQLKDKTSILDVGAGDLSFKLKMQKFGFKGEYHTQDLGKI